MKPVWALQILNAEDLERQAAVLREESRSARCPGRDSGGVQCTRDRHEDTAHHIDPKDTPEWQYT